MAEAPVPAVILDCAICLESLNNPRILPCSHLFCDSCISEYIISTVSCTEQKSFNCPTCRNVVDAKDPSLDKSEWASYLPLMNIHHETNAETSSKSAKMVKQICHPCQLVESKTSVAAHVWCRECNEALCPSCSDTHSRLKITKSHTTVQIEDVDTERIELDNVLAEVNEKCTIHENQSLVAFCVDHSEMCCIACLTLNHKRCENTKSIDSMVQTNDRQIGLLQTDIHELVNQLNLTANRKEENKISLRQLFQKIEKETCTFVTDVKKRIDDLSQEFRKNAHLLEEDLQNDLSSNAKQIREYSAVLHGWEQNIEVVRSFGSNIQAFVMRRSIKTEFAKISEHIKSSLDHDQRVSVSADFKNTKESFSYLKTIADIVVSKEDEPPFTSKLSILNYMSYMDIKFDKVALKECPYLEFNGKQVISVVNVDGIYCAVLCNDKSVYLINISSKTVIDSASFTELPKRLCYDPETKTLYITCHNSSGITYKLNDLLFKSEVSYSFPRKICGIDICDGTLFIIADGVILMTGSFTDRTTCMVAKEINSFNDDIAVDGHSERLAVLKRSTSNIYFATVQAKILKAFIGNENLKKVSGIAFGPSGLLFVATNNPCSIHVISRDEKNIRTISTEFQKLRSIENIHVDREKCKLYLCGTGYVEIFDIQ